MAKISMIACVSSDNGLGKDNDLLWKIPEDQKFFRRTTRGHAIVMGGKTHQSIGRLLPGRENIVLSRERPDRNATWFSDEESLRVYLQNLEGEVFIIGGASLYSMFLDDAEAIYLTEVYGQKPAEVFFPEFDKNKYEGKILLAGEYEGIKYEICKYTLS